MMQRFFLVAMICMASFNASSQIEVAQVNTRYYSSFGLGGFLNFGFPVMSTSTITIEGGFYYFKKSGEGMVLVPMLLGCRHSFNEERTGPYVEPTLGYTIGATDVTRRDANGLVRTPTGDYQERDAKGPTAGICAGYIFPGSLGFNVALRYQHIFVKADPALDMYSLRFSFPVGWGRKE